ncbi:Uncharacterised protein [uncultured archaeon]|nr:Uncharacterised protein [uncultured archaeon]
MIFSISALPVFFAPIAPRMLSTLSLGFDALPEISSTRTSFIIFPLPKSNVISIRASGPRLSTSAPCLLASTIASRRKCAALRASAPFFTLSSNSKALLLVFISCTSFSLRPSFL